MLEMGKARGCDGKSEAAAATIDPLEANAMEKSLRDSSRNHLLTTRHRNASRTFEPRRAQLDRHLRSLHTESRGISVTLTRFAISVADPVIRRATLRSTPSDYKGTASDAIEVETRGTQRGSYRA